MVCVRGMMCFGIVVVCAIVAHLVDAEACSEPTPCGSVIFSGGRTTNAAEIRGTYTKGPCVGGQPSFMNEEKDLYLFYYGPHKMWHIYTESDSDKMTAKCDNCHTTADLLTTTWSVFTTGDKANPGSPQVDSDMRVDCGEVAPCVGVMISGGTSTNAAEIRGTYMMQEANVGGRALFMNYEKSLYLFYYVPHRMWHIHTESNSDKMTAKCDNCHTTVDLLTATWSVFTFGDKSTPGSPQVDNDIKVECVVPTPDHPKKASHDATRCQHALGDKSDGCCAGSNSSEMPGSCEDGFTRIVIGACGYGNAWCDKNDCEKFLCIPSETGAGHDGSKCADKDNDCCASSWFESQKCFAGYIPVADPQCKNTSNVRCAQLKNGNGCFGCFPPENNAFLLSAAIPGAASSLFIFTVVALSIFGAAGKQP